MNRLILDLQNNHAEILTERQRGEETHLSAVNKSKILFVLSMTTDIPRNATWMMLDFEKDVVSYRLPNEGTDVIHMLADAGIQNRYEELWEVLGYKSVNVSDIIRMATELLNADVNNSSEQSSKIVYLRANH